ncbi:MAG TPA: ABATE domain-containing protein [Streptosporangiaceae bacterium]
MALSGVAGTAAPLLGEPLPVELMNTVWADRDGLHDELRDAAGLAAWLQAVAGRFAAGAASGGPGLAVVLPGGRPARELAGQFRELRDGLRGLAAAVTGDPRARAAGTGTPDVAAAVRAVNAACARAPLWSRLTWAGPPGAPARTLRSAGTGPEAALSWIAEAAVLLFTGPDAGQLRACPGPGCVLYFVRAHPRREWCSAVCGNRARVARHYQRHRPGANRPQPDTPGSQDSTEDATEPEAAP